MTCKIYRLIYIYIYIKDDSLLWIRLLFGLEVPLNFKFNGEKTWGQHSKNISQTPFKVLTK